MSTQAHTAVRNTRTELFGWSWCTTIERDEVTLAIDFGYEPTRDEAVAAAHLAIARLNEQLMDELHASRSARRAAAPLDPWQAQRQATETDVHTLEATA